MMVGSNGKMWEHAHPGVFVECNNPDNGTAGWFVENFRNMMITEDEDVLWLIKGTPREWLNKNNTLAAEKVPTMYGPVSYEVCVDEMGVVRVEIQSPERETPSTMKLRLRHPTKAIIDNVTVNGQKVDCVDEDGETLTFCNPKGTLNIVVEYK